MGLEEIASRAKKTVSRAFGYMRSAPAIVLASTLALGTASRARADVMDEPVPIVNIYEDDGVPVFYENAIPGFDALVWRIYVQNNSDVVPEGSPYNENCRYVYLRDVYSQYTPGFNGAFQAGWTGGVTQSSPNYYTFYLVTNIPLKELTPGMKGIFEYCTFTNHDDEYIIGAIEAQGYLESAPTEPVMVAGPVAPFQAAWNPADFDMDGKVDGSDLLILEQYWGMTSGARFTQGDTNGDGCTDVFDYICLKQNLGKVFTEPSASSTPEPSSLLILGSLGVLYLLRRSGAERLGRKRIPGTFF